MWGKIHDIQKSEVVWVKLFRHVSYFIKNAIVVLISLGEILYLSEKEIALHMTQATIVAANLVLLQNNFRTSNSGYGWVNKNIASF